MWYGANKSICQKVRCRDFFLYGPRLSRFKEQRSYLYACGRYVVPNLPLMGHRPTVPGGYFSPGQSHGSYSQCQKWLKWQPLTDYNDIWLMSSVPEAKSAHNSSRLPVAALPGRVAFWTDFAGFLLGLPSLPWAYYLQQTRPSRKGFTRPTESATSQASGANMGSSTDIYSATGSIYCHPAVGSHAEINNTGTINIHSNGLQCVCITSMHPLN